MSAATTHVPAFTAVCFEVVMRDPIETDFADVQECRADLNKVVMQTIADVKKVAARFT